MDLTSGRPSNNVKEKTLFESGLIKINDYHTVALQTSTGKVITFTLAIDSGYSTQKHDRNIGKIKAGSRGIPAYNFLSTEREDRF